MAIKLNFKGIEFAADTPAEALALAVEFGLLEAPAKRSNGSDLSFVGRQKPAYVPSDEPINKESLEMALRFLEVISENPQGVKVDRIKEALDVSHEKAVGSKSAVVNRVLKQIGFPKESVYKNPKKPPFGRTWSQERYMKSAIQALQACIADFGDQSYVDLP